MRVFSLWAAALLTCAMAQAQTVEISGSSTVKDAVDLEVAAIKATTGIEVKTLAMGTGRGMVALFQGKAQMAAVSESLDEAVASARKTMADSGLQVTVPANLAYHEIARQSVVVYLHKDNPIGALSKAQLKDVFLGKVRNWKEVGGIDAPVQIFLSSPGSATRATFQKIALDGQEIVGGEDFRTSVPALEAVARTRGGIAFASPTLLDNVKSPTLKIAKSPPVERSLALVTVGPPTEAGQKVIDHLRRKK